MVSLLSSCFPFIKRETKRVGDTLEGCVFCNVDQRPDNFKIVWQDDVFVAFEDRSPSAKHHILVCPKKHVDSIKSLTKDDTQFLKDMHQAGIGILDRLNIPEHERRMGFHIPPYNSIDHLHLHVHALPYKSAFRALKYPVVKGWGPYHKGLSWFAEIRQSIAVLESGRRVGVLPC